MSAALRTRASVVTQKYLGIDRRPAALLARRDDEVVSRRYVEEEQGREGPET
jgi:hypothetical protein